MGEREQIEQQIQEVLATETQAIPLSNKLFHPQGLFNQLAATEAERRSVAGSPLFKRAQRRLLELQQREAAEFARFVQEAESLGPQGNGLVKLEGAESA